MNLQGLECQYANRMVRYLHSSKSDYLNCLHSWRTLRQFASNSSDNYRLFSSCLQYFGCLPQNLQKNHSSEDEGLLLSQHPEHRQIAVPHGNVI
mmetsp:Transcript_6540/g.12989  ORF Transcript_6540/g.12989 Transcript_6540/m.12989 type:complete len:94 (-) Transcript_6540:1357-1638(-)